MKKGTIKRIIGPVVDVDFGNDLPDIYTALEVINGNKKIIDELPIKKEFLDIRYVKGAIFWNVKRDDYNKSQLNKIINHKSYKLMTIRNVNTARYLAGISEK